MMPNTQETKNNNNIQLVLPKVNQVTFFQRMLRIYLTLIMTTNKEMSSQLVINMILKAKLISKMLLCNQVMAEDIQLCSPNINTTFQRTPKTYQILTMITNRETFYQQVTITILKAKLTSRTLLCNQVMVEDTQLCLTNRKQQLKQKKMKKTAVMKEIVSQMKKITRELQKRLMLQFKKKEITMKLLQ